MTENSSTKKLKTIFYPKSIAVIGTNRVRGTVPYDILHNILKADFQGVVYPVSPKEPFIDGVKSYKYVVDIPDEVDLGIIVFPSSVCHMALEQCGKKGIKSVIIISAGFKEIGGAGIEREKQIKEIATRYGISFIGPNCLGLINTDQNSNLNASFAREMPEPGSIAFLSQSGALCTAVLDYARARHIGFSKFVSFGNKADINEIDLLNYLKSDRKTKVILLYLEEIINGRALMEIAEEIIHETGKPILALKSGRTSAGASAAASHTGSLAGSDEICNAAFQQAGIIRCDNIEQMFNYAIAFAYQPLPENKRVAIITNAGGPGVLVTDSAIFNGLEMASFSGETLQIYKRTLPRTANIKNPVDVIGDARADRYNIALSSALKDENVDGCFVILTPQSMTDIKTIADEICKISHHFNKPIYASFMGEADVASGIEILQKKGIPHYSLPESMCSAFATTYSFKKRLECEPDNFKLYKDINKEKASYLIDSAIKSGKKYLAEDFGSEILKSYGLPVIKSGLASSSSQAVQIANKIGYPVAMKIMSDDIVHKYDVKGVVLNIKDASQVEKAFHLINSNTKKWKPKAKIRGILVSKMIESGEEVILGLKRDLSFGPVIMFGLGGIFVEIFKDVSFRVAPISHKIVKGMIRQIKSYALLAGARGKTRKDVQSIEQCILRLSQLAIDFPQIKELDINPLIVRDEGKGCYIADIKIML